MQSHFRRIKTCNHIWSCSNLVLFNKGRRAPLSLWDKHFDKIQYISIPVNQPDHSSNLCHWQLLGLGQGIVLYYNVNCWLELVLSTGGMCNLNKHSWSHGQTYMNTWLILTGLQIHPNQDFVVLLFKASWCRLWWMEYSPSVQPVVKIDLQDWNTAGSLSVFCMKIVKTTR